MRSATAAEMIVGSGTVTAATCGPSSLPSRGGGIEFARLENGRTPMMDRDQELGSWVRRPAGGTQAHEVQETNEVQPMDEQASAIPTPPALPGQPTAEPGVRLVDGKLLYCDEWL